MDRSRAKQWLVDSILSPVVPLAILLIIAAVVRGWGNYPINDDWQYSHIAKRFAETGEIHIDRPIAPALIVQTILGGWWIKLFGFSFAKLKFLTFIVWTLGILAIDQILRVARVGGAHRSMILVALLVTPYTLLTSVSFMTEVYGATPALLAILVWIRRPPEERVTVQRASLVAALGGIAFLTRQFAGLVVPAILLGFLIKAMAEQQLWPIVRRNWFALGWCGFVFVAIVATHWLWSHGTANETDAIATPLKGLLRNKAPAWSIMSGLSILYLVALAAPILILLPAPSWRKSILPLCLVTASVFIFRFGLTKYHTRHLFHVGKPYDGQHYVFNASMPFMTNLVGEAGLGPMTTTDVYMEGVATRPRIAKPFWKVVEYGVQLLLVLLLWLLARLKESKELTPTRRELALVGATFAALTLAGSLQTYGFEVFDRYLWTPLLGITLALGAMMPATRIPRIRIAGYLALTVPLALFTILAAHDYFLWQRYRWHFYTDLTHRGISPLSIDGGYETNGWYAYDAWRRKDESPSCVGKCACRAALAWYCIDDSYRIGFGLRRGDLLVDRVTLDTWLVKRPTLFVGRRPDP